MQKAAGQGGGSLGNQKLPPSRRRPSWWRAEAGGGQDPADRPCPTRCPMDLVGRQFTTDGPDQTRLTDITEHPTGEGKLYL